LESSGVLRGLALVLLAWVLAMPGCAVPQPSPTPVPTASPTPSVAAPDEMSLTAYLDAVAPYASMPAVVRARELSVVDADLILFKLQRMHPPQELEEAHGLLVAAYRYIREGRQILAAQPIRELRAEGEFQVDWGIRYIFIFQEEIAAYMKSLAPDEGVGE